MILITLALCATLAVSAQSNLNPSTLNRLTAFIAPNGDTVLTKLDSAGFRRSRRWEFDANAALRYKDGRCSFTTFFTRKGELWLETAGRDYPIPAARWILGNSANTQKFPTVERKDTSVFHIGLLATNGLGVRAQYDHWSGMRFSANASSAGFFYGEGIFAYPIIKNHLRVGLSVGFGVRGSEQET
jgi:hypothetical protein